MNDLARAEPGERALAVSGQRAAPNPLKQLPEDWRRPVGVFYATYSDIIKGTLGIVTRFRVWIDSEGLTLAEAERAMQDLIRPARAAEIEHPGQLMAALAGAVESAMHSRKSDVRRRMREAEMFERDPPMRPPPS